MTDVNGGRRNVHQHAVPGMRRPIQPTDPLRAHEGRELAENLDDDDCVHITPGCEDDSAGPGIETHHIHGIRVLQAHIFGSDGECDMVAEVDRMGLIVIRLMGEVDQITVSREGAMYVVGFPATGDDRSEQLIVPTHQWRASVR